MVIRLMSDAYDIYIASCFPKKEKLSVCRCLWFYSAVVVLKISEKIRQV